MWGRVVRTAGLLLLVAMLVPACARGASGQPGANGLAAALLGTWRPVEIPGYVAPPQYPNALRDATITFGPTHRLTGTDGCNVFSVDYRVGPGGELRVGQGSETAIGCANVPNDRVVSAADRFLVRGASLTVVDAHGQTLGRYERVDDAGQ